MENNYNLLEWDTRHFGYKVACVRCDKLEIPYLKLLMNELKDLNFGLAYFFVNPTDKISNNSLTAISGFLADEKITFHTQLRKDDNFMYATQIRPYQLNYTSEKLKLLAFQSGIYSRFKLDKKFVNNEFEKLYTEWIDKSVKKEIADEVLTYYKNDEEKGFVTVHIQNNVGSIGLIAVDESERGNSIGKQLMSAAMFTFKEKGIYNIEVVTQGNNRIACEFYKSLGFMVKTMENIYHIWIK